MRIRKYEPSDLEPLARLFYETVHAVNRKDYTARQLEAWAPGNVDLDAWNTSFRGHLAYVATINGLIAGFGDIDGTGYLDRLFVHKDFQRRGVAAALCGRLESEAGAKCITVRSSVTARPFFEKRGNEIIKAQEVERRGVWLKTFMMMKSL